jgi:hypothetical protein
VQFYLHKCGEVELGGLRIIRSSKNGPIFVKAGRELPLALLPMPIPKNIKNFKGICLKFALSTSVKVSDFLTP